MLGIVKVSYKFKLIFIIIDDSQGNQLCRFLFYKWSSLKNDFLPLLFVSMENKKVVFNLLIIMVYITQPVDPDHRYASEFQESLEVDKLLKKRNRKNFLFMKIFLRF